MGMPMDHTWAPAPGTSPKIGPWAARCHGMFCVLRHVPNFRGFSRTMSLQCDACAQNQAFRNCPAVAHETVAGSVAQTLPAHARQDGGSNKLPQITVSCTAKRQGKLSNMSSSKPRSIRPTCFAWTNGCPNVGHWPNPTTPHEGTPIYIMHYSRARQLKERFCGNHSYAVWQKKQ